MASSLAQLPLELQLHIFSECDPADLGKIAVLSKSFNHLVKGNQLLFKETYLRQWDDPTAPPTSRDTDWEFELKRNVAAIKLLTCNDSESRNAGLPGIAQAISSLVSSAAVRLPLSQQRNIPYLSSILDRENKVDILRSALCQSALFSRANGLVFHRGDVPEVRRQQLASAKMHCLYGVPQLNYSEDIHMYPYAASKVYDLRNYKTENRWGPFLDDGSDEVDWEKLEAIMIVLAYNIQRIDHEGESSLARLWKSPFAGTSPYTYQPYFDSDSHGAVYLMQDLKPTKVAPRCSHAKHSPSAPWCRTKPDPELEKQDPYGISGTWLRIVCFLDYRDLYEYNFGRGAQPRLRHEPRPPISTDEAVRLIVMTLVVTGIHWPDGDDDGDEQAQCQNQVGDTDDAKQADVPPQPTATKRRSSSANPKRKRMPIVSFTGTARALHSAWDPNANSAIRGTVMTTPEGEVRWTSVSVYHGIEERWKSEGIQVGGIQSARGVIGSWFDKDYAPQGPAGPTAFWKVRDDVNCDDETGQQASWVD